MTGRVTVWQACLALAGAAAVVLLGLAVATSLRAQGATSAAVPAQTGADLFRAKGCAGCHVGPDSEPIVFAGPPLTDIGRVAATRRPGQGAEAYIRQSIVDPRAFNSDPNGQRMPGIAVSPEEVDALVAYLLTADGTPGAESPTGP